MTSYLNEEKYYENKEFNDFRETINQRKRNNERLMEKQKFCCFSCLFWM